MAERVEIIITAKDQASKAFRSIGDTAKGALTLGLKAATGGFLAFGAAMGGALKVAMDAEQVQADLNAVIKSTGGIAGWTADEANALADSLAWVTRFSDETIISAQSMLLTFTKIGEDVMPLATETALNMAEKFGGLESASIQLGKALNDPIAGVGALREVGVSFTEDQQAMINSLVETGDIAGAQKIILDELGVEVGGLARAMGDTAAGKIARFKNRLIDVGQTIGAKLVGPLGDVIDRVGILLADLAEFGLDANYLAATFKYVFGYTLGQALWDVIYPISQFTEQLYGLFSAMIQFGPVAPEVAQAFVQVFGYDRWWPIYQIWMQIVDVVKTLGSTIIDFVKDNLGPLKDGLIALAAFLGGAAIVTLIGGIAGAIIGLLTPVNAVLLAVGLLGAAWSSDFLGMQTATKAAWKETAPILGEAKKNFNEILPMAIEITAWVWENRLMPLFEGLWKYFRDVLLPVLNDLAIKFLEQIPLAIDALVNAWENVLYPAIDKIWRYFTENVIPIFSDVVSWLEIKIPQALSNAAWSWENIFKPALEAVSNFITGPLMNELNRFWNWLTVTLPNAIGSAIAALGRLIQPIENVINKIGELFNINVPDWAKDLVGGIGGVLGLAEGGYKPEGVTRIVGERGPEALVSGSGFIIPNNMLPTGDTINNTLIINSSGGPENAVSDLALMRAWSGS